MSLSRYPIDFDDNVRQQTENCSNEEDRKRIREFASMTAIGFKHQVRKGTKSEKMILWTDLFIAII